MKTITRTAVLTLLLLAVLSLGRDRLFVGQADVAIAAGASCESLASLALQNAKVDSATTVATGAFTPPGGAGRGNAAQQYAALPSFCRVMVTSKPTSDSDIKIEDRKSTRLNSSH